MPWVWSVPVVVVDPRTGDKTEAAYFRSDLFQKRIRLMKDWREFLDKVEAKANNVIPMQGVG